MTSLQTSQTPGRGRPRKFDEEAVLDRLTELFWDKGYEATSMADILDASGLQKSSLYNAFGSKDALFRKILSRYIETRMEAFADMAEAHNQADISALHAFLDAVFSFGRAGCLAVNTTTELGASDEGISSLAQIYRQQIRVALQKVVRAATAGRSQASALVESRTEMLLGFLLGYAVAARTGASDKEMNGFADAAHGIVKEWA